MGIEPTRLAWKARVLPLNYTRIYYVLQENANIILRKIVFVKGVRGNLTVFSFFVFFVFSV